jgi:RNase adaptor protein for sRNA GlmZ degradation
MESFQGMLRSEKLLNLHFESSSGTVKAVPGEKPLAVRIFSFSFHRGGVPKDESGNGGGYVFDCRSVPNPGREERFKSLTGKDAPVIEFLDHQESGHEFFSHVRSLVDASLAEYQRRGFKNLMISFGCTGGQHRSVYFAEQLAKHLRDRDGLEVAIHHRELERPVAHNSAALEKSAE